MNDVAQHRRFAVEIGAWGLDWLSNRIGNESIPKLNPITMKTESDFPDIILESQKDLSIRFGNQTALALASYCCFPFDRGLPLVWNCEIDLQTWDVQQHKSRCYANANILILAEYILTHFPTKNSNALLLARLRGILRRELPIEATQQNLGEGFNPETSHFRDSGFYIPPAIKEIAGILEFSTDPEEFPELISDFLNFKWDASYEIQRSGETHVTSSYRENDLALRSLVEKCFVYAIENDRIDYDGFTKLAQIGDRWAHPYGIGLAWKRGNSTEFQTATERRIVEYNYRFAAEQYRIFEPEIERNFDYAASKERFGKLIEYSSDGLVGIHWLLQSCEHIENFALLTHLNKKKSGGWAWSIIHRFATVWAYDEGEDEDSLKNQLKRFKPETLWLVFPFSGIAQRPILELLKAQDLCPLHEYVNQLIKGNPYGPQGYLKQELITGYGENDGVLDVRLFDEIISAIPKALVSEYFKSIRRTGNFDDVIYLCEAALGTNRAEVEKPRTRPNYLTIKASGLLPLTKKDELPQRYLALRTIWKECSKHGADRQVNTRAAVTVALKNLAQRAGYADVARFEWAMEERLTIEAATSLRELVIGDWVVDVEMEGLKTRLHVSKAGKKLKSVPSGLRKFPEYKELLDTTAQLDEQARRFRKALENMMCKGETLSPKELSTLGRITVVNFLLSNLIGIDETGNFGLIDAPAARLIGPDKSIKIKSNIRIAHVADLFQHRLLSHWQKIIVDEKCVQPFKQAFRELYIVTPAEQSSSPYSYRYAGRKINSEVAYRLLQSREWRFLESSDGYYCARHFPDSNLIAYWSFPAVKHYFAEEETLFADTVCFKKNGESLDIGQVPTALFSEVMRDLDLVVSVATSEDESYWSTEIGASRMDVLREIMGKLGFRNVAFEDNFVLVQGKRAKYRIHIGSGNIHIMPGAYLCVVPKSSGKEKPIYLPFADSDPKTTEIISKIILLSNDDEISDPSIERQIVKG